MLLFYWVIYLRCYPIKKRYLSLFYGKEDVLLTLLKEGNRQIDVLCERIDICDFSLRCIRFYKSWEYELKNTTISYTNEISKEKNYCALYNNHLRLNSLKGFDTFLERYFENCFLVDDNFTNGIWFSYEKSIIS